MPTGLSSSRQFLSSVSHARHPAVAPLEPIWQRDVVCMSVRFGRGFGTVSGSSMAWVWELCSELGYRAHAAPVTLLVGCNRFVWDKYAGRSWSARCNASLVKVTRQGRGVGSGWVGAGARSVSKFRLGVHFTPQGPPSRSDRPSGHFIAARVPNGAINGLMGTH